MTIRKFLNGNASSLYRKNIQNNLHNIDTLPFPNRFYNFHAENHYKILLCFTFHRLKDLDKYKLTCTVEIMLGTLTLYLL